MSDGIMTAIHVVAAVAELLVDCEVIATNHHSNLKSYFSANRKLWSIVLKTVVCASRVLVDSFPGARFPGARDSRTFSFPNSRE